MSEPAASQGAADPADVPDAHPNDHTEEQRLNLKKWASMAEPLGVISAETEDLTWDDMRRKQRNPSLERGRNWGRTQRNAAITAYATAHGVQKAEVPFKNVELARVSLLTATDQATARRDALTNTYRMAERMRWADLEDESTYPVR